MGHLVQALELKEAVGQHGIGRAAGRARIFGSAAGSYRHPKARGLENQAGKLVPAGLSLAGGVISAEGLGLGQGQELRRQGQGAGGAAPLVIYYS